MLAHYLDRVADKQPNIAYTRPEVEARLEQWTMLRDVLAGEEAVKNHDLATLDAGASSSTSGLWDRYLPMPNDTDQSAENKARYRHLIERAIFYPVTKRTRDGMVGQAFLRDPVVELPAGLEYLETDCDGAGVGIVAQARKAYGEALGPGAAGLLVDYPKAVKVGANGAEVEPSKLTKGQQEALNLRPTIGLRLAESIINWRTTVVGARKVLVKVVLSESAEESDDGFEVKRVDQWRVLYLDESGRYVVELYRRATGDGKTGFEMVAGYPRFPTGASGARLDHIPYHPIGAVNNDIEPDPSPLVDHATLNLGHYRASADFFEDAHVHGQTTVVITGLNADWLRDQLKGVITIGSRGGVPLPGGADAKLLQSEPNTAAGTAMDKIEGQMRSLGAKLLGDKQANITATEARQNHASEISVMGTVAGNVGAAYALAINDCAMFMGAQQTGKFDIDPEFELGTLTAQELRVVGDMWTKGMITDEEMRDTLRAAGYATKTLEEFKAWLQAKKKTEPATEPVASDVVPGDNQDPLVGDEGQPEGGA